MFEKQYNEHDLVQAYLETRSQVKAAAICRCSRETVARAVRKAGIKLDGYRYKHNGGGGSKPKITDAELCVEAQSMTRFEIARKHNMNVCNIDRKLHRLGISCVKAAKSADGRIGSGHHYHERAAAYGVEYDKDVSLKKLIKRDSGICQLCGRPVDTSSFIGNGCGLLYPTIDHIVPLSKGGSHTWGNVQLAHMKCNSIKGDRVEVAV